MSITPSSGSNHCVQIASTLPSTLHQLITSIHPSNLQVSSRLGICKLGPLSYSENACARLSFPHLTGHFRHNTATPGCIPTLIYINHQRTHSQHIQAWISIVPLVGIGFRKYPARPRSRATQCSTFDNVQVSTPRKSGCIRSRDPRGSGKAKKKVN